MKYVEEGLISGIILLNIRLLSELSESLLNWCPVVQCNEYENVPKANLVSIDNNGATREITEHLIKSGKKKLAFLSPQYAYGYPVKFAIDREYGFRQALEENGIQVNSDFIIRTDYTSTGGNNQESIAECNRIAEMLLTLPVSKRPDGIVCTNDIMAVCCINTAHKLGIRVPEELAVTAFDNTISCFLTTPNITSIEQPNYEMGYESAKLLISAIEEKPTISKRILLPHRTIIRGSSAK
jgi:DNA-binding LacI/PurR family transcriptional regulator